MWLSEQSAAIRRNGDAPEVAAVTIPGSSPAARVGSERRGLTVMAPGGYVWIPGRDAEVLTVQCATGETAVSGQRMDAPPAGMQPGEVYLHSSGGASVLLRAGGQIEIRGSVEITGGLTVNGLPVQLSGG